METNEVGGGAGAAAASKEIALALTRHAARLGALRDIHKVRVRAAMNGYIVIFHCRADPGLTVEAAHARVDALERAIRDEFPKVVRIIGHAEPTR
jgi:divalent metal cation (Fe/Co/Zn/Cd) transporter